MYCGHLQLNEELNNFIGTLLTQENLSTSSETTEADSEDQYPNSLTTDEQTNELVFQMEDIPNSSQSSNSGLGADQDKWTISGNRYKPTRHRCEAWETRFTHVWFAGWSKESRKPTQVDTHRVLLYNTRSAPQVVKLGPQETYTFHTYVQWDREDSDCDFTTMLPPHMPPCVFIYEFTENELGMIEVTLYNGHPMESQVLDTARGLVVVEFKQAQDKSARGNDETQKHDVAAYDWGSSPTGATTANVTTGEWDSTPTGVAILNPCTRTSCENNNNRVNHDVQDVSPYNSLESFPQVFTSLTISVPQGEVEAVNDIEGNEHVGPAIVFEALCPQAAKAIWTGPNRYTLVVGDTFELDNSPLMELPTGLRVLAVEGASFKIHSAEASPYKAPPSDSNVQVTGYYTDTNGQLILYIKNNTPTLHTYLIEGDAIADVSLDIPPTLYNIPYYIPPHRRLPPIQPSPVFMYNETQHADDQQCNEIQPADDQQESSPPNATSNKRRAQTVPLSEDGSISETDSMFGAACTICGGTDWKQPNNDIVRCEVCQNCYHQQCEIPPLLTIPDGDWTCHECLNIPTGADHDGEMEQETLMYGGGRDIWEDEAVLTFLRGETIAGTLLECKRIRKRARNYSFEVEDGKEILYMTTNKFAKRQVPRPEERSGILRAMHDNLLPHTGPSVF